MSFHPHPGPLAQAGEGEEKPFPSGRGLGEGVTLRNRTLFITGASRGIGLAIALRAARDGANVIVAAKTDAPHPKLPGTIHTAAAAIEAAGGRALPVVCDVRDEAQIQAAIAKGVATFGGIDALVNNASAISLTATEATDARRYDLMQQVNARNTRSRICAVPAAATFSRSRRRSISIRAGSACTLPTRSRNTA